MSAEMHWMEINLSVWIATNLTIGLELLSVSRMNFTTDFRLLLQIFVAAVEALGLYTVTLSVARTEGHFYFTFFAFFIRALVQDR